jgi:hypothetical protein
MDMRQMRRVCAALVDDLRLPVPAEPQDLFAALSAKMTALRGRPVEHMFMPFPPQTYTGLYVQRDTSDIVLIEAHTSLAHQLRIFFHEFWHLYAGHPGIDITELTLDGGAWEQVNTRLLASPQGKATILAARSGCSDSHEDEAELFSWQLAARVSRWMPEQHRIVAEDDAEVVGRLEAVLAYQRGVRQWTRPVKTSTR